jgi:hypothetical protein
MTPDRQTPASVVEVERAISHLDGIASRNEASENIIHQTIAKSIRSILAHVERLSAEREGLVKALTVARHALVCTENLRCTDQSIEALAAKLVNGIPREQLEFMTDFTAELALIDAALTQGESRQTGWQDIASAPLDGREALVYRPLARLTRDEPVAIKRLIGGDNHCWPRTVPEGATPCNPTDGSCHVTHWQPLPAAPTPADGGGE